MAESTVTTAPLKRFARRKLPQASALREVLLAEGDSLSPVEFLSKLDIWLKLLEREER